MAGQDKQDRLIRGPVQFQELVAAYRELGVKHNAVCTRVKCSLGAAKRAYFEGWPEYEWAPPIKTLLEQEGLSVRAAMYNSEEAVRKLLQDPEILHKMREEVRKEAFAQALVETEARKQGVALDKEKAAMQAIQSRSEEAEFAKLLRGRGRVLLAAGGASLPAFSSLGDLLRRRIELIAKTPDKDLANIDPHEILALMTKYTEYQLKVGVLVQAAQVIDRKAAGDPDFVHLHKTEEMTYEEAQRVIEGAAELSTLNGDVQMSPEYLKH